MEQQTPREPRRAGRSQRRGGVRPAGADAAPLNFTGWGVAAVTKTEQTFHKENPGFSLCCQHFFHVVLFEMFLIVSRGRGARPQAAHSRREPPPRAPGRSLQNAGASAGQGGAGRGAGRSQRRGGVRPKSAERARLGRRREGRSAAPGVAAPGAVRVHRFIAFIFGANKKRGEPAELPPGGGYRKSLPRRRLAPKTPRALGSHPCVALSSTRRQSRFYYEISSRAFKMN